MPATAIKKDINLWKLAKKKALEKMHGIHSARAMQLAVKYYKDMGGRYVGKKTGKEKLAKWTKEKWTTRPGTEKIARRLGTTARYLPEKAWKKLTKAQQIATDVKKRIYSKGKKQSYVKNTKIAEIAGKIARNMSSWSKTGKIDIGIKSHPLIASPKTIYGINVYEITSELYLSQNMAYEAVKNYQSRGDLFSGWIVRNVKDVREYSDPIKNKEQAIKILAEMSGSGK
jgi:hypothetical protein